MMKGIPTSSLATSIKLTTNIFGIVTSFFLFMMGTIQEFSLYKNTKFFLEGIGILETKLVTTYLIPSPIPIFAAKIGNNIIILITKQNLKIKPMLSNHRQIFFSNDGYH